ncbi:BREX-2 system adenine-specific DNA-methyltransferase PglX [Virgisporangium ochraceum]|nr:BREX-2 system adenine-specific DNA-methyltransferase PglX [Virgisporangium ochraceum]
MIPLKPLQAQVRTLVDSLRETVPQDEKLYGELRAEWGEARRAERTAATFETWLEDVLDQAAVAWVLGCVFVRFCEDNRLVSPLWIGGPADAAPAERAVHNRQAYLMREETARNNDMHWLREAFTYLRRLPATGKLFDHHNPVWRFAISGDAAEALSDFFRRGPGLVSLVSEKLETRFLGDLYQDLSAHARSTYALLQTPEFVEEFILDRTFEPALKEFGLAQMSVIDPTCGSGHFLLGAFRRLVRLWKDRHPADDVRELVQKALHQVTGVDINPFAVAIARFRLMVAALRECGLTSLEKAPAFDVRVATGDSLLPWSKDEGKGIEQTDLLSIRDGEVEFAYAAEDFDLLKEYLRPSTYTVVVGNPPYITVKDKAQNERYRSLYSACSGKYALTVPFAQRIFGLAKRGDADGVGAGWVGQITANSFMKREFGKKLINEFFAGSVELAEVVDTSGAFIPGHGTPTVVLIGRNRVVSQRYSNTIRSVLSVRGEPTQPAEPSLGLVWAAIVGQIDRPGSESPWVSSIDWPRDQLARHPWSLSGGGRADLRESIDRSTKRFNTRIEGAIGFASFPGQDDAYFAPRSHFLRRGISDSVYRELVTGDAVRDWAITSSEYALTPYDAEHRLLPLDEQTTWARHLWYLRRTLRSVVGFAGETRSGSGEPWWGWYRWIRDRYRNPYSITFGEVATHNHFVLDRGGKALNRTAPVVKLPKDSTENDHLELVGLLNSSTACFWLKQVCHDKGIRGEGGGFTSDDWERFYQFNGTRLQQFPVPAELPLRRSTIIDRLAQSSAAVTPTATAEASVPTRARLIASQTRWHSVRTQMIAHQEELDWEVYRLYGLLDEDLTVPDPPELQLGERAFEIVLARKVKNGETETQWFARHNSTPITELPAHWPDEYRAMVERRIAVIESDRNIELIERPECKRRWSAEGWDAMQSRALRDWLLDRLEDESLWGGATTPMSVAQMADRVRHDTGFRSVLDLWVGHDQHDLTKTLGKLIAEENVPYLPALRYKPSGLRKRLQWEQTWALQRREDAGEKLDIPVPPKYASADFVKNSYWRNRGKLDVPKERFVSYPGAGRDGDPTDLLGWAGWDHLGQAQALATVYIDRKTQAGWSPDRLLPLLAGLVELEPWLHQWHNEPKPGFPGTPAEFFTSLIDTELSMLGHDRTELNRIRGVDAF